MCRDGSEMDQEHWHKRNGHKLMARRFQLDMRGNFPEQCPSSERRGCGASLTRDIPELPGCNPVPCSGMALLSREAEPMPHSPLQPDPFGILGFWD